MDVCYDCPDDGTLCPTCRRDGWRDDDSTDDTGYDRIANDLIRRSADIASAWNYTTEPTGHAHIFISGQRTACPDGPHWGCHNLAHREH